MATAQGFAPSFYYAQNTKGLGIWVASGSINGTDYNGQLVNVPANATTFVWVTENGVIGTGAQVPSNAFPIAQVVSGQLVTSGNTLTNSPFGGAFQPNNPYTRLNVEFSNGILSITDIRPTGAFSF